MSQHLPDISCEIVLQLAAFLVLYCAAISQPASAAAARLGILAQTTAQPHLAPSSNCNRHGSISDSSSSPSGTAARSLSAHSRALPNISSISSVQRAAPSANDALSPASSVPALQHYVSRANTTNGTSNGTSSGISGNAAFHLQSRSLQQSAPAHPAPPQPPASSFSLEPLLTSNLSQLPLDGLGYPFSAIGQLASGCSAFMVGPCHLLTVAHCVYDPQARIWWPGLEFYPARNAPRWEPLGHTGWTHAEVRDPEWKFNGDPNFDYAVVQTRAAIGSKLGWLDIGDCAENKALLSSALAGPSAGAVLNMAGYPDTKANGSFWGDACGLTGWRRRPAGHVTHGCEVSGGDSGAPLWAYDSAIGKRRVLAMHIASEKTPASTRRGGAGGGGKPRRTPLAVPLAGANCEWIKQRIAQMHCSAG